MQDIDYKALGIRAIADECKKKFFYFVKTFWDVIISESPIYNWHIPYLCDELQKLSVSIINREPKPYDLIINIPPGTTKSTIITIMFPAWLWANDPTIRIITNSYSGDLSIEHSTKSKDIIVSEKYMLLFPQIKLRPDKQGKQHYENTFGGFRYSTSTGSTITGYHAHVIINDDPLNPKQASSEHLRFLANEHIKTLSSRKVNKESTPMVTVMQRLHAEDVTGYLLKRKGDKIRHICLPAELSDMVNPFELRDKYVDGLLDPLRLNVAALEEAKIDLGSKGYAGQYQQTPTTEGGNIVKRDWFRTMTQADFKALRYNETMHFYLDTAYNKKKLRADNDPSGIIAACRIGNNIYIADAMKVWKEMPDLLRFLPEYMSANGADDRSTLNVEPRANGESVIQMLRELTTLNVKETATPKDSKEVRLRAVSPRIECGRVYLVEGNWNDEFLTEVCGFPTQPHDEYVDVLGYAINDLFDNDDDLDFSKLDKGMFGI